MEKVVILFGTTEPIWYHEADDRVGYDVDVSFQISGSVTVYEYPQELNEESLSRTVKETAVFALEESLHNLPSGRPLYASKNRQQAILGKAIEDALLLKGIRAEAEIVNFKPENESKEELDAIIKEYIKATIPKMYVDEMYKPNVFEKVGGQNNKDLPGGMMNGFGPAPVDEPCKNPETKNGGFSMMTPPVVDKDAPPLGTPPVSVTQMGAGSEKEPPYLQSSPGTNGAGAGAEEQTSQPQSFMEMMGEITGMNSLNEGEKWTCPNCKTNGNEGNFCPECGAKRPPFGSMFQGL